MSDFLLRKVWTNLPKGQSTLALLMAIAESANEQGNCYITIPELALAARMSRYQAMRAITKLLDERWIVKARVPGYGPAYIYQINIPKVLRSSRVGLRPSPSHPATGEDVTTNWTLDDWRRWEKASKEAIATHKIALKQPHATLMPPSSLATGDGDAR